MKNEARLSAHTGSGFAVIERPGRKRLQIEASSETRSQAEILAQAFGGKSERLPRDWLDRFCVANAGKPLRIGRRLVIHSLRGNVMPREPGRGSSSHVLGIPAGAAFGTGEHATTAMVLRLLERVTHSLPPGWRMLDAGTGSGILALAAARFGAKSIIALDNDPLAISTARENGRANGIRSVKFVLGDVKESITGPFDIVTANLYSELLAAMMPQFDKCMTPDGRLILSGVLRRQEARLARSLRRHGFGIQETRRRGKWIAFVWAKQSCSES